MFRSAGMRFIVVGVLALLMFIPLGLVSDVINERSRYSEQTISTVSEEWGGGQLFSGPLVIIPVTEDVTYDRRREAVDAVTGLTLRDEKGRIVYEHYEETVTEDREPVYLYPDDLDIAVTTASEVRHRGIFTVPVYTADVQMAFAFDAEAPETMVGGKEVLHWDDARVQIFLSSNRGLRGEARLLSGEAELPLEPVAGQGNQTGVEALLGDFRKAGRFDLSLGLNGAQSFSVAATGRTTRFSMTGDWSDPSFFGDFLPDSHEIGEDGFKASWSVPHLARSLPQVSRGFPDQLARRTATMGARFITPNDFYQKAWRSARYGLLFIALTFLTILLLDRASERPAHPVQYLMVGLAQSVFVLLMVAYAEHFGFGFAYLLSAGATIVMLTLFGATALKLGKRTVVLGTMLVVVYAVLYLILRSADFALLAGSTLAFIALAGTMWITRNEDWHGPKRAKGWPFVRPKPAAEAFAEAN